MLVVTSDTLAMACGGALLNRPAYAALLSAREQVGRPAAGWSADGGLRIRLGLRVGHRSPPRPAPAAAASLPFIPDPPERLAEAILPAAATSEPEITLRQPHPTDEFVDDLRQVLLPDGTGRIVGGFASAHEGTGLDMTERWR
jgi:hypothetical protein